MAKGKDSTEIYLLVEMENRIQKTAVLINSGETDSIRKAATASLSACLDSMLHLEASYTFRFDSLRTKVVSVQEPADKVFRIYTYNTVLKNGDFKNFGFVQYWYKRELVVVPLMDTSKKWNKELLDIDLDPTEWVGALYYKVIPFKKKKQKMYLLLGFDGSTIHSNKKVMDVITFNKGEIRFGAPVFKSSDQDPSAEYRVTYEFHQESSMVLTYEKERNIIVADKLGPSFPEANNNFYFYIPTGDYDYYIIDKNGNWVRNDFVQFNVGSETPDPTVYKDKDKDPPRKKRRTL